MPFEAKPYFRNEMSSQVSKIANGVQKSIDRLFLFRAVHGAKALKLRA